MKALRSTTLLICSKHISYFHGVSDATVGEIARLATVTNYDAAAVVHQLDDPLTSICFVLRGRVKAVRVDSRGEEHLFQMFERGEQYGMILGGLGESVPLRVFAVEPSMILSLDHEKSMELMLQYPELRRPWLQSYARNLRRRLLDPVAGQIPKLVAMLHQSPATRSIAQKIIERLQQAGESVCVLSDADSLAVDTGCAVPFTIGRQSAHGSGGDSPTDWRVEPGQTNRSRYHRCSEPRLGRALASSRLRSRVHSAE